MPRLQGLIFDLEGTLVDGSYDLRQALNATLKSMDRREVSLDEVKAFSIDGMLPMVHQIDQLINEFNDRTGLTKDL